MAQGSIEQVIYTSIAGDSFDAGDLFKLVQTAHVRNAESQITGLLVYVDGRFFEAVEGEAAQVSALMSAIKRDPRHHSILEIRRNTITHRQFFGWRMRRINVSDKAAAWSEFQRLTRTHQDALSILEGFESYLAKLLEDAA